MLSDGKGCCIGAALHHASLGIEPTKVDDNGKHASEDSSCEENADKHDDSSAIIVNECSTMGLGI